MAFIFVCGSHTFQSLLEGYENVVCQCQNCGNYSGRVYKRHQWFTFCWIPIIPFSFKPWHEIGCHICNFYQDIRYRPDVEQMRGQSGPPGQVQQGPQQGWQQSQQDPRFQQYQQQGQIAMQPYSSGANGPSQQGKPQQDGGRFA
ncbi:hypothetical protein K461DRAFT_293421 [Myriangium duriaei CBS 260.36]|uniref:Zinc-ribbon 15 domain-containing protein n=1 Tax=Myriangium duriaei CBS 260.36 TaxID=1168546 RepID=A0A9P4J0V4_9PEZI|nr:hypothetical protein K461DRAFT_293421 [Myriangium duriaei CBS 260.36]